MHENQVYQALKAGQRSREALRAVGSRLAAATSVLPEVALYGGLMVGAGLVFEGALEFQEYVDRLKSLGVDIAPVEAHWKGGADGYYLAIKQLAEGAPMMPGMKEKAVGVSAMLLAPIVSATMLVVEKSIEALNNYRMQAHGKRPKAGMQEAINIQTRQRHQRDPENLRVAGLL